MSRFFGIDFGSSTCSVAEVLSGESIVVSGPDGEGSIPSCVAVAEAEGATRFLVGRSAQAMELSQPEKVVRSLKRFLGRRYDDRDVQRIVQNEAFSVQRGPKGEVRIQLGGHSFAVEELAALPLATLHKHTEADSGQRVVVAVPAYFGHHQRQALKHAAELAGWRVMRLLSESLAAVLGAELEKAGSRLIALCSFGAGGFDVSIARVAPGLIEMLGSSGRSTVGSDDIDYSLGRFMAKEGSQAWNVEVESIAASMTRLRNAAASAKEALSTAERTEVFVPAVVHKPGEDPQDYERELERHEVDTLIAPLVRKLAPCLSEAMSNAQLSSPDALDEVYLLGGGALTPLVESQISSFFGRDPLVIPESEHAVAQGAARLARAMVTGADDVLVLESSPHTIGVAFDAEYELVLEKSTVLPTRHHRVIAQPQSGGDSSLCFEVYQGESERAERNHLVGRFEVDLDGRSGETLLTLELTTDVNGILRVDAHDLMTGQRPPLNVLEGPTLGRAELKALAEKVSSRLAE